VWQLWQLTVVQVASGAQVLVQEFPQGAQQLGAGAQQLLGAQQLGAAQLGAQEV
jgi:hypothetical protein